MAPSNSRERLSNSMCWRSQGWEPAHNSSWSTSFGRAWSARVSRVINPTAVLGGVHCCSYLYLLRCSPSKGSQLGLCSRDTELWLPSKPGPRRVLSRLHSQRRMNERKLFSQGDADRASWQGGDSQEDVKSWHLAKPFTSELKGHFLRVLPSPEWLTAPSWKPLSSCRLSLRPLLITCFYCFFFLWRALPAVIKVSSSEHTL